ncbi:MAG: hypothetical protein ACM35G_01400, partial [Planctomycetaceae bacterium]
MRTQIRPALAVVLLVGGAGCSLAERNPVPDAPTPRPPARSARPLRFARVPLREAALPRTVADPADPPRPNAPRRAAPGFDDASRLTEFAPEAPDVAPPSSSPAVEDDGDEGVEDDDEDEEGEGEEGSEPPARVVRPPGFPDGVQLSQGLGAPPGPGRTRSGRAVILDFSADGAEEDQQDTNLDRPRAGRRGGGGGPTRIKEEEDQRPETEEDEFKSDLLI